MDARRDSVHQELLRTPKSTESVALRRRGSRATAYWAHGPRGLHGGDDCCPTACGLRDDVREESQPRRAHSKFAGCPSLPPLLLTLIRESIDF